MKRDDASRDRPDSSELWGTEPPKLSGAGWRRAQQLAPTQGPPAPPGENGTALGGLEERLRALEAAVAGLAHLVQQAGWSSSAAEMRAEIDALRGAMADLQSVLPTETLLVDLVRAEGERTRATLADTREAAEARWNALLDGLRDELARAGADEPQGSRREAVERARQGVETLHAALGELRSSLSPGAQAELGALIQGEARTARTDVAALRSGPVGEQLARLQTEVEGVRDELRTIGARLTDLPSFEALVETVMHQADRSQGDLRESMNTLRAAVEDLGVRSERLAVGIGEVATRLEDTRPPPLEPLERTLRFEIEGVKAEILGAADEADNRQRTVMAALAREVVALTEGQVALREDFNKLLARLLGRRT